MCINSPTWNYQIWELSAKSLLFLNWAMWMMRWLCVCQVLMHSTVFNWGTLRCTNQLELMDSRLLLPLWVCTVKCSHFWCAVSSCCLWIGRYTWPCIFRYGVYLVILLGLYQSLNVHMRACSLGSPLSLWSLTEHLACSSCNMNSQVQWKLGCVNVVLSLTQPDICVLFYLILHLD
jgi:hypothetical protein